MIASAASGSGIASDLRFNFWWARFPASSIRVSYYLFCAVTVSQAWSQIAQLRCGKLEQL